MPANPRAIQKIQKLLLAVESHSLFVNSRTAHGEDLLHLATRSGSCDCLDMSAVPRTAGDVLPTVVLLAQVKHLLSWLVASEAPKKDPFQPLKKNIYIYMSPLFDFWALPPRPFFATAPPPHYDESATGECFPLAWYHRADRAGDV